MKRGSNIVIMIEPAFKDKLPAAAAEKGRTISAYIRDLIITDLRDRKIINDEFLLKVLLSDVLGTEDELATKEMSA